MRTSKCISNAEVSLLNYYWVESMRNESLHCAVEETIITSSVFTVITAALPTRVNLTLLLFKTVAFVPLSLPLQFYISHRLNTSNAHMHLHALWYTHTHKQTQSNSVQSLLCLSPGGLVLQWPVQCIYRALWSCACVLMQERERALQADPEGSRFRVGYERDELVCCWMAGESSSSSSSDLELMSSNKASPKHSWNGSAQ